MKTTPFASCMALKVKFHSSYLGAAQPSNDVQLLVLPLNTQESPDGHGPAVLPPLKQHGRVTHMKAQFCPLKKKKM